MKKTQTLGELKKLVDTIVLFKARNIKAAEWEMGMMTSAEKMGNQHRVEIIMKNRVVHSFDAKDYIIKSRA